VIDLNSKLVFRIPETVKEDTAKYEGLVRQFMEGKVDPERFKGYRVPMGIYGQRGNEEELYMVRVRIPGGVLSRRQLMRLNEISKEYGKGFLHFTTRQDIQLHGVKIEDTPEILYKLLEVGLSPRGGGGNTVRNILNSPRAGVNPDEVFDTTPHALALSEYLLKDRSSFNLPRKYKIAFSSTLEDDALATVNDLGFIAKRRNGKRGFKVYAAGGMGNSPAIGIVLEEFIEEDKIFYVAEAIKRLFDRYGDRDNKHKARLRFVRERLGDKGFIEKYRNYLAEVIEKGLKVEEILFSNPEEQDVELLEETEIEQPEEELNQSSKLGPEVLRYRDFIYREKKPGLYSLEIRPENGDLAYPEVNRLLELLDSSLSLRTTNKQGLLLRGIKERKLLKVIKSLQNISQNLLVPAIASAPIACKGASTCRLGLCLSPELSRAIRKELLNLESRLRNLLPQIYISGCPNSCGQHYIAPVGFEGRAKRYKGRLVPHYSLLLGGHTSEDETRLARRVIDIPARKIPEFLKELVSFLDSDSNYTGKDSFNKYLQNGGFKKITDLASKYTAIPEYQEDPQIYRDWGQEQDFSLQGRGPGECGMGVLDIIRIDIETAKEKFRRASKEGEKRNENLYETIISAARALLVIKGIDTTKDRVIIEEFKKHFIDGELVKEYFEKILDAAVDYKLGDEDTLNKYEGDIGALVYRIEELYNSLNSRLEFDLSKLERRETDNKVDISESARIPAQDPETEIKAMDLRGVKCPLNFVKAKLFLEPLPEGEIVEIYLDEGEPIANVPPSLEKEGHDILTKEKNAEGYCILKVKKGSGE